MPKYDYPGTRPPGIGPQTHAIHWLNRYPNDGGTPPPPPTPDSMLLDVSPGTDKFLLDTSGTDQLLIV